MCTSWVPIAYRGQKRVLEPLGWELQPVTSHRVGAGNWTPPVLCNSSKDSSSEPSLQPHVLVLMWPRFQKWYQVFCWGFLSSDSVTTICRQVYRPREGRDNAKWLNAINGNRKVAGFHCTSPSGFYSIKGRGGLQTKRKEKSSPSRFGNSCPQPSHNDPRFIDREIESTETC